jgi:nicotinate-nucleotide adenylyltransferase
MDQVEGGNGQRSRIGILGGTFDPVHVGHLVAAVCVRQALALDTVLMIVANEPWQKVNERRVTKAEDRFSVVAAAVEGVDGVEASRIEIDRGGPSYTADTVEELLDRSGQPADLFLIVGGDLVNELDAWVRVDEVMKAATLVVVERGGVPTAPNPPGWRVERVEMPAIDLSSSELRTRFSDGRPVDFLIPAPAIERIRLLGLYAVAEMTATAASTATANASIEATKGQPGA